VGPLAGIRVADFTWVWAGPHAMLQLAHLGAEVIRVESMSRPCVTRLLPPWPDAQPGVNRSGYFNQFNQGKRSIVVDLKSAEGVTIARRLAAVSDVAAENFAAGVLERLGLGWDVLHAENPRLIMIALSGYGATGPEHQFVSYGPAQVPLSGMSSLTGYRDWPPMHVGISNGDPNGGMHGALAVLAALWHRQRTGEGQYIDLSQWETSMAVLGEGIMAQVMTDTPPERAGNRDPWMTPHGIFRAAGPDRWIALAIRSDAEWQRFGTVIGRPECGTDARFATLAARQANEDALEALVTAWTIERSPEESTAILQQASIPAFPAMTNQDLHDDPHLAARDFFVELDHPEVGRRRHLGIPWKMSATPCAVTRPAPCLGEATDYVLGELLGYSAPAITALRDRGIVG
jgi:crotonobetainyl-CoA:carnitine CoA-transferase CaiB-like acyl-CoA transferase